MKLLPNLRSMQLDKILDGQRLMSEQLGSETVHDEHLFIVTHQGNLCSALHLPFSQLKKKGIIQQHTSCGSSRLSTNWIQFAKCSLPRYICSVCHFSIFNAV